MIIYKATNTVNGKVYIGLTSGTLERRISEHRSRCKYHSNFHFHNAIRKYGFDVFEWEVIDCAIIYDDLKEKEMYWIEHYDSYNKGYNSTLGGDGLIGIVRNKGEDIHNASITNKQALEIIELLKANLMTKEIAEITGVSQRTIQHINYGETWSHLYKGDPPSKNRIIKKTGGKGEDFKRTQLTKEQAIEVKRLLANGVKTKKLTEQFGVSRDVINHIKYGQSWKWLKTEYDDKIVVKPKEKLSDEKVIEIKKMCLQGLSFAKIGEMYNVTPSLISLIHRGKRWSHVELPVESNEKERKNARSKLNDSKVVEIKKLLNEGMSQTKIAEIYNVARDTIGKIYRGQSWKHVKI